MLFHIAILDLPSPLAHLPLILTVATRNPNRSDALLEKLWSEMEAQGIDLDEHTYRSTQITGIDSNDAPRAYATFGRLAAPEDTTFAFSWRRDWLRFHDTVRFDQRRLSPKEGNWLQLGANRHELTDIGPEDSLAYVSGQNLPLVLQFLADVGLDDAFDEIEYHTGVDVEADILDSTKMSGPTWSQPAL
jgi:hypothetical protein